MKKLKFYFLANVAFLFFATNNVNAQDQMYWIHVDHVKPAMKAEYAKTAKEFADACKTYNIPDLQFNVWLHDNGSYFYSSPMKNFADMDKDGLKPLRDKMGADKFKAMFERFDKCYDSHQSFMATYKSDLSFTPDSKSAEGDYNKYHYMYVTPANSQSVAVKLKEIKDLWAKKGSKLPYIILHSGFGAEEEFYLAIFRNKNAQSADFASDENNKILGEEWGKKWNELYPLLTRYNIETSMYQTDLSYPAKK
jgi:hypothetical protein